MATLFSRIISGEIPCHKVAENAEFLAFLDIQPIAMGHTLVIPKKEVDYIFDLDDTTTAGLYLFAKEVARKIKVIVPCVKVGVAVIGLEVPHAHVHLVPLNHVGDLSFTGDRLLMSHEDLAELASKIQQA